MKKPAPAVAPMLATHAALVGLTPLVPVPFLDDVVKAYIERRMTREIARRHAVDLDDDAVKAIAEGPGESILLSIGKGALLLPVKFLFRKVFIFLEVKRGADAASVCIHRGLMLDTALSRGVLRTHSPAELRMAIDRVLATITTSPVNAAFRSVFESSKDLVKRALESLVGSITGAKGGPSLGAVESAVDGAGTAQPAGTLADRMRRALDEVPTEFFDDLEKRILAELGLPDE